MSAFKATYSDWKLIKTRGVVQVVMEVPLADADAAYTVLGGMPNSAKEQWFGIAPIKPAKEVMPDSPAQSPTDARPEPELNPPARAKRDWRDLQPSQQAGIRCAEPQFREFLREERGVDWCEVLASIEPTSLEPVAECVRLICGVGSRADLNTNQKARVIWNQLNSQFEAWMRVGA